MPVDIAFAIPLSKSNTNFNSEAYTMSQFIFLNVFLISSTSQQFGSSVVDYYLSFLSLHFIRVSY